MNIIAILLSAMALSCSTVYSITNLDCPIQYIDKSQSYFIGIKNNNYRIGTAIDAITSPNEDMPQFSGKVKDCTTQVFKCKSIAYLKFVVPKKSMTSTIYDAGPTITIVQLDNGGWYASAFCRTVAPSGCANRKGGPMVTYQYAVNSIGILTVLNIQHWNDRGMEVDQEHLLLSSKRGLML